MKNYHKRIIIIILIFLAILISVIYNKKSNNENTDVEPITVATSTETVIKINEKNDFYTIDVDMPIEKLDKNNTMQKSIKSIVNAKKEEWKIGGAVYNEEQNLNSAYPDRPKTDYLLNIKYKKYESKIKNTVSYVFENYEFAGGAHGNTGIITYTFNANGLVNIKDILNLDNEKDIALTKIVESKLRIYLAPDYNEQMLVEGLGLVSDKDFDFVSNFKNFVILDEGIKIIFEQYQVAAYAVGMPEVMLTWKELEGYTK